MELHTNGFFESGGVEMSKYILEIRDKDPQNDIELEYNTAQEATDYKNKAIEQGYEVKVRKEK